MLLYDNLADVQAKLVGTFIYFNDEIAYVKDAKETVKEGVISFLLVIIPYGKQRSIVVPLGDKSLNYTKYNIGYANYGPDCVWWCRIPLKQYQQGLKSNQLKYIGPNKRSLEFMPGINFDEPTVNMLRNSYPSIEDVLPRLKALKSRSIAFHKNFALSYDNIHGDFILEYKGVPVGHMTKPGELSLLKKFQYLEELIQEVM